LAPEHIFRNKKTHTKRAMYCIKLPELCSIAL
jgi:hypothetical protein